MLALIGGAVASAGFAAIVATRIFAGQLAGYFRFGNATTGSDFRSRWRSSAPAS